MQGEAHESQSDYGCGTKGTAGLHGGMGSGEATGYYLHDDLAHARRCSAGPGSSCSTVLVRGARP